MIIQSPAGARRAQTPLVESNGYRHTIRPRINVPVAAGSLATHAAGDAVKAA
jgi:hypothetical protein